MAEQDTSPKPTSSILDQLIGHRWFTFSGWLVGLISLLFAIGYAIGTSKHRQLAYSVNPTSTVLVQGGGLSDLHVSYKGQELGSDLTAVQVLIWNAGKESIRQENVFESEPVRIITSHSVRIIEAQLRGISRPVINFTLDTSHASQGIIYPHWRILEHNDGATIQLLLAGPASTDVTVRGVIEGQGDVAREIRPAEDKLDRTTTLAILIPFGILMILIIVTGSVARLRDQWHKRLFPIMFLMLLLVFLLFVARMLLYQSVHPSFASW